MSGNMLQGKGRFVNRRSSTQTISYDKFFIYIPTNLARDSAFPLEDGDQVKIVIDGKMLRIEKASG